jgi:signal transduction histidine kinase
MSSKYSEVTVSTPVLASRARFHLYSSWPRVVVALLVIQTTLVLIFGNATALSGGYEFSYFVLLLLACAQSARNAIRSRQTIRLFWSFLAGAMALWALLPLFSMCEVILHQRRNPFLDMTPGFLHIVFIIAAVAARPHLKLPTEKPYRTTLSFLTLLFFGVFIYVYVFAPYAHDQHAPTMILQYEILYFTANVVLLLLLVFAALRSQPPWASIYRGLLGASTVYTFGSLIANLAWAWGRNHYGGLTGLPFTASIGWFAWIAIQGREMANELERTARQDTMDIRRISVLAMLAVLAIPLIGLFELFRVGELDQTHLLRLELVQVAVLILGLVIFIRAVLANRDMASSVVLANDRLRLAVEAGKMYAYEWDVETDEIVRSPECAHILDWIEQPTTDTRNNMLDKLHPDDRQLFDGVVRTLTPATPNFQIRYRMLSPGGTLIWLENSGHALFDEKGKMLGTLGMIRDITERKQMEEALEKVSGRLIAAQEKERSHLARELHDDICQRLAMLSLRIEKVTRGWGSSQKPVSKQLEEIWQQCSTLTGDVQALSHELHPSILDNLGLVTAVKSFCREVSQQNGAVVDFAERNIPTSLPREVALSLFRVIQEALHNAVKYSGQKHFEVRLQGRADEIELEVSDRGSGFELSSMKNGRGLGLVSMTERIHLLNGRISIDSKPNVGTTVRALVPLATQPKAVAASPN